MWCLILIDSLIGLKRSLQNLWGTPRSLCRRGLAEGRGSTMNSDRSISKGGDTEQIKMRGGCPAEGQQSSLCFWSTEGKEAGVEKHWSLPTSLWQTMSPKPWSREKPLLGLLLITYLVTNLMKSLTLRCPIRMGSVETPLTYTLNNRADVLGTIIYNKGLQDNT